MNTSSNEQVEANLAQLSREDMLALIKHMVQLYPDLAELIKGTQTVSSSASSSTASQSRVPFNEEFYRNKVQEIFYETDRDTWGSEARAAGPLYNMVDIAKDYASQQDYVDAATLYNLIIQEIFDNYDSFH